MLFTVADPNGVAVLSYDSGKLGTALSTKNVVLIRIILNSKLRSQYARLFFLMIPQPGLFPNIPECGFAELICVAPNKNTTGQLTPLSDDTVRHTDSRTKLFKITHLSAADPAHPIAVGVNPPVEREAAFGTKELILVRVSFFVQLPYY